MIGWNFPLNNDGEVTGLNNAGIETFLGDPILSLAREVNQNSLDAADNDSGRPVEVHFKIERINAEIFPGATDFDFILDACQKYWEDNKKANSFFKKAKKILSEPTINLLRISDFYTTGLTGSESIKGSNWANLIKAVGSSDKDAGAGGSFGIGKHAPFACTAFRTVFYSTLDIDGKCAFQGVSKLVTHSNIDGHGTQGTGYYGDCDKNAPINVPEKIPEYFRRERVGTDLFVFGFEGGSDWERKIIRSVLENFFAAIHQRKLIVVVGSKRIDDTTLPDLMKEYFADGSDSDCTKYFEAFTSDVSKYFELENFQELGKLELHILPGAKSPKRVAILRQTGMLLFYKGHFQTPMKFAGVLRATGASLNELLRSVEPPSHNKWEPERHENPSYAKKIINQIFAWVRNCVKETSHEEYEAEYDFEGMHQFLPDDFEDESAKASEKEGEKAVPKEVELVIRSTNKMSQPDWTKQSEKTESDSETVPPTRDPKEKKGPHNPSDDEEKPPKKNGGEDVGKDGKSERPEGETSPTIDNIRFKKLRAFCNNPATGEYRVIFQSEKNGEGFIQLRIVGEVEQAKAPVVKAMCDGVSLKIDNNGLIGPLPFLEDSPQKVDVILANKLHCALEVVAYENK